MSLPYSWEKKKIINDLKLNPRVINNFIINVFLLIPFY